MTKLKEPIAIVKLGHGEIGYFDKITRLRLTRKAPYGRIYDDMDLKNIRRSVKVGRLILVNGMLPAENANYSRMAKRFIPSSNYDMVASGLIHPEDIMEKTVARSKETEFDLEAALAEAKENLEKVNEEKSNGLQEKEEKVPEVTSEETPKAEVVPEETEAKDIAEETLEEESAEEVEDETATEDKPKKTRGRKKASK
uniref:Uncharacterized protein n=1 Tax=virus sp. ctEQ64 TaxID=2825809 RepID=A0A8S5RKH3_9VIRU|nr:MAG TPA: hypothetical protein [virus sp. ctEQ64]